MRRGLTRSAAATAPDERDPRLRGRTYAIPFDTVWEVATRLVGGGVPGWGLREADDQEGVIEGSIRGRFRRFDAAVTVRIRLDADAQTRVDAVAGLPSGKRDLGCNARRLGRFFRSLDHALEAGQGWPLSRVRLEPAPWS